jgi:hypothetical protein
MERDLNQIAEKIYLLGTLKEKTGFSSKQTIVRMLNGLNENEVLQVAALIEQKSRRGQ